MSMPSNVPVPPPPHAPPFTLQEGKERMLSVPSNQKIHLQNHLSYESNAEQELIDTRNRLWELEGWKDAPLLTVYQYIPSILQDGPQCGLVALAMAAASCQTFIPVQQLLHEAQMRGYSYRGEMFSVDNMASLALSSIPNISIEIINELLDKRDAIVHSLARGAILLIPYDADRNHAPCCRKGHKAHWAAVCGALVCSTKCLITARQGKSRRLMLWDFAQLALSNNNLTEFSPERGEDCSKYLLPEGGVRAGLCGRAIILQRL